MTPEDRRWEYERELALGFDVDGSALAGDALRAHLRETGVNLLDLALYVMSGGEKTSREGPGVEPTLVCDDDGAIYVYAMIDDDARALACARRGWWAALPGTPGRRVLDAVRSGKIPSVWNPPPASLDKLGSQLVVRPDFGPNAGLDCTVKSRVGDPFDPTTGEHAVLQVGGLQKGGNATMRVGMAQLEPLQRLMARRAPNISFRARWGAPSMGTTR